MNDHIDKDHPAARGVLRTVGPIVLVTGLIFTIIGLASFFGSFGDFGAGPPRYFWCAFIGLPLMGFGMMICKFAFLGTVSRYVANETAPVGKDVVNYMADGTQGAVKTVASAIREGLSEPTDEFTCTSCGEANDGSAKFCKECGSQLLIAIECPDCGQSNDRDAKFCDNCGTRVA